MGVKVVALIGEPATGKSTVANKIYNSLSEPIAFKQGLLFGTYHAIERVYIFGKYGAGIKFPGTDRLSMAVQPHAVEFIKQQVFLYNKTTVFFEGDRLGTASFLKTISGLCRVDIFCLQATDLDKKHRHLSRADTQSEIFIKGRATKISNIMKLFPNTISLKNQNLSDIVNNTSRLIEAIKNPLTTTV